MRSSSTYTTLLALTGLLLGACSSSSTTIVDKHDADDDSAVSDAGKDVKHDATGSNDAGDDATVTQEAGQGDAGSDDAGDDTGGGTIHDSGAPDTTDAPPTPVFSADAGTTWSALYRDYFGNDSQVNTAGCSNGSDCHSAKTDEGYMNSGGYLCPKGDKNTCWMTLTQQGMTGPDLITADAGWENDFLSQVLCQVNDAGVPLDNVSPGNMPYNCAYNFTPTDIQRIKTWVESGYPNN